MRLAQRDAFTDAERKNIVGKIRTVAGNTWEYDVTPCATRVRLHHTDIVTFPGGHRSGTVILNSGGWQTPLTKDRINDALKETPYKVQSERAGWFVYNMNSGARAPFVDGMTVPDCFAPGAAIRNAAIISMRTKLAKQIIAYAKKITVPFPQPSTGDCWICMAHAEAAREREPGGGWSGGASNDVDHRPDCLHSHLDEGYIHGTLIINAMRFAGYSDIGIAGYYNIASADWAQRTVRSAVRRYLRLKLGLPR